MPARAHSLMTGLAFVLGVAVLYRGHPTAVGELPFRSFGDLIFSERVHRDFLLGAVQFCFRFRPRGICGIFVNCGRAQGLGFYQFEVSQRKFARLLLVVDSQLGQSAHDLRRRYAVFLE